MQQLLNPSHAVPFSGRVKLIFTDIDGTFVNLDKQINPAVKAAAMETIGRGLPLAFATGRNFNAVKPWMDELGMTSPQIINNGAEIVWPQDGSHLQHLLFNQETIDWLYSTAVARGFRPLICRENYVYASGPSKADWMLLRNKEPLTFIPEAELLHQQSSKIAIIVEEKDHAALVKFSEDIVAMAKPQGVSFKPTFSEIGILVISPATVGKLNAIHFLCDYFHCTVNDVMAIGDGDNDAEMLSGVGCAVAMGNAMKKALAAANYQVPDNVHDGIVEAFQFAWEHR